MLMFVIQSKEKSNKSQSDTEGGDRVLKVEAGTTVSKMMVNLNINGT